MKYFFEFVDTPHKKIAKKMMESFEAVLNTAGFNIGEDHKPVVKELRDFVASMELRYRNIWHFKIK